MATRQLPPLSSLRSFEAVVRLGSVRAAAEELGRTHGAVSKQIQALQQAVGAPLFERAGAGIAPNAQGRVLGVAVGRALDDLADAYRDITQGPRPQVLDVACSVTFATRWLASNLTGFSRDHPQVQVRLTMVAAHELKSVDADLIITDDRRGFSAEAQKRAVTVAPLAMGPVHLAGYPAKIGEGGLTVETRLDDDFRGWTLWSELSGKTVQSDRQVSLPHAYLSLDAALGGEGAALADRRLVRRELRREVLVAPLGFVNLPDGVSAIPRTAQPGAAAAAMIDWLRTALAGRN